MPKRVQGQSACIGAWGSYSPTSTLNQAVFGNLRYRQHVGSATAVVVHQTNPRPAQNDSLRAMLQTKSTRVDHDPFSVQDTKRLLIEEDAPRRLSRQQVGRRSKNTISTSPSLTFIHSTGCLLLYLVPCLSCESRADLSTSALRHVQS